MAKAVSASLLTTPAVARWVEARTGPAADALISAVEARLHDLGIEPLAVKYR
ncbi:MAG: hypothetical protein M3Q48_06790 [Actinomycetota bacterium]|nr:hypothetical protein [Actinomycetota bacterium]